MTPFEDIIGALGEKMGIPLHVDAHQSCRLEFEEKISVQIDLDGSGDRLLIGSTIGRLNPGPYREAILKQAMITNTMNIGVLGILAYSEKNDELVQFAYLPLAEIKADSLFAFIQTFVVQGNMWFDALNRGEIPQIDQETQPSGFFGLQR